MCMSKEKLKNFILILSSVLVLVFVSYVQAEKVVVLLYHRFDDSRYPTTSTTTEELLEHIRYVKSQRYEIWKLKDLEAYLRGDKKLEGTAVVFTVDDGYLTTFTRAYPVFQREGVPFSVFLYVEAISRYPDYMTWQMVREMMEDGVEIGVHSYSHEDFTHLLQEKGRHDLKKVFLTDTLKALEVLERELGYHPEYYSYPYGHLTEEMKDILKDLGFTLAFTQDIGPLNAEYDPLELPREPLLQDWATPEHVKIVFRREPAVVIWRYPDIRGAPYGKPIKVKMRVKDSTVKYPAIYVSEHGWVETIVENDMICSREELTLKRGSNRFGIRYMDAQGRWLYRFWYVPTLPASTVE